jgi:predicted  nucleic acid-binding Zn-ribbon protein
MTDDLVKRLRVNHSSTWKKHEPDIVFEMYESDRYTAADRIEELEKQITELASVIEELVDKDAADRIERLERALHRIEENEDQFSMQWAAEIARAALEGKTE